LPSAKLLAVSTTTLPPTDDAPSTALCCAGAKLRLPARLSSIVRWAEGRCLRFGVLGRCAAHAAKQLAVVAAAAALFWALAAWGSAAPAGFAAGTLPGSLPGASSRGASGSGPAAGHSPFASYAVAGRLRGPYLGLKCAAFVPHAPLTALGSTDPLDSAGRAARGDQWNAHSRAKLGPSSGGRDGGGNSSRSGRNDASGSVRADQMCIVSDAAPVAIGACGRLAGARHASSSNRQNDLPTCLGRSFACEAGHSFLAPANPWMQILRDDPSSESSSGASLPHTRASRDRRVNAMKRACSDAGKNKDALPPPSG